MRTTDLPRLEAFYTGPLGMRVLRRDPARGSVWLEAGGAVLMLETCDVAEPPVPAGSLELVCFAIDAADRDAFRARVTVEAETASTLYFRDPDGRRIGVSSYVF